MIATQEAYLLRTRLHKMPYKHIAAHLRKTELACRLHYHQLSQGSNRRRRNTSVSSTSSFSSDGHSPIMRANIPSPVHEHAPSRSMSISGPIGSYGYTASGAGVQLPSITDASMASNTTPRLPAILPKPANMTMSPNSAWINDLQTRAQPSAPLLEPVAVSSAAYAQAITSFETPHSTAMPPLRLDCSAPPPSSSAVGAQPVDMARLQAVYGAHRGNFWSAIAADYGNGLHPTVLEQAWRTAQHNSASPVSYNYGTGSSVERDLKGGGGRYQDKTRISAILGIDANPRSPGERELVRRMEEGRVMVGVGA